MKRTDLSCSRLGEGYRRVFSFLFNFSKDSAKVIAESSHFVQFFKRLGEGYRRVFSFCSIFQKTRRRLSLSLFILFNFSRRLGEGYRRVFSFCSIFQKTRRIIAESSHFFNFSKDSANYRRVFSFFQFSRRRFHHDGRLQGQKFKRSYYTYVFR